MEHFFYSSDIQEYIKEDAYSILGKLAEGNSFTLEDTQRDAWIEEIWF